MKTSFSQFPAMLLVVAPLVGFLACANRGMEAPTEPFVDGLGGGVAGAGGSPTGAAGAAAGGSVGTGGSVGGRIGTGGSGAGAGAGGTGGTSTGGITGSSGGTGGTGGTVSTGGVVGTGGVPASTGGTVGTGGAAGMGGRLGSGGVGGTAGGAAGATQLIVSIDFIGGRPAGSGTLVGAPAMAATETAGFKPAMNWNGAASIAGTLSNLHASDGSVTSATVTWDSPPTTGQPGEWTNGFTDAPGDVRMMNGYLDPASSGSPATVKVSGLPAAITGSYDVYVYGYGDVPQGATRRYQYAIGSSTVSASQTGPATPFPGLTQSTSGGAGNTIIFRKVSGATFTLTATPGTGDQSRAPINGIQIVWPSGS